MAPKRKEEDMIKESQGQTSAKALFIPRHERFNNHMLLSCSALAISPSSSGVDHWLMLLCSYEIRLPELVSSSVNYERTQTKRLPAPPQSWLPSGRNSSKQKKLPREASPRLDRRRRQLRQRPLPRQLHHPQAQKRLSKATRNSANTRRTALTFAALAPIRGTTV